MNHNDRDVRFDLALRIDEEIDRQLDSGIGLLESRTRGYYHVGEIVSYRFTPDDAEIPRGMFDERCVARGFKREGDALWHRGPLYEGYQKAFSDTDKIDQVKQTEIVQRQFVVEAERILRQANVLAEES